MVVVLNTMLLVVFVFTCLGILSFFIENIPSHLPISILGGSGVVAIIIFIAYITLWVTGNGGI